MTWFSELFVMFANATQTRKRRAGIVGFCFMTTTKTCQYADGMVHYAEWTGMVGFCFMTKTKVCQGTGVSGWERAGYQIGYGLGVGLGVKMGYP